MSKKECRNCRIEYDFSSAVHFRSSVPCQESVLLQVEPSIYRINIRTRFPFDMRDCLGIPRLWHVEKGRNIIIIIIRRFLYTCMTG